MNTSLREQLIRAEQQFLLAVVSNDEESLKVFSQEWSQLTHIIASAEAAGQLDDNTALLLSQVSRAIENITTCMLESGAILQEAQAYSISDFLQDIPSGDPTSASHHPDAPPPCHLLFSNLPSSTKSSILGQKKVLDSYAYCWLVQNIHNPYPNSGQTRIISDLSGASTTQVELWFQEIREMIGWSKLSRDFFAGSVNATVAAARRVYLEHDRNISFDITFAFTTVKAFAEALFSEHPASQGKNTKTVSARALRTVTVDQYHRMDPFPDESIIEPETVVPPRIDILAPLDSFSDLFDSDESEEEDTTPPPSIAGCKRPLTEDVLTSKMYDLERPQKRCRSGSVTCAPSELKSLSLPSTSSISSDQVTHSDQATFISPSPSSHLSPPPPESPPSSHSSISHEREIAEFNKDTLEGAVSSPHTYVSTHGVRKRRLSQSDLPVPFKRQCRSIIPPTGHFNVQPMSSSHSYLDLSLSQDRPSNFNEAPQPMLSVLVNPDAPVNFGVFNWNSISDPSAATAASMSQPSVVYIPSSDLKSQLLEPPDSGHDAITGSDSSVDLGLVEDQSSSLQFPLPASLPDPSTLTASPHLDGFPFPLEDFDWSSFTEFLNSFSPSSMQSSSPSPSLSALVTPLGSSQESFAALETCDPIRRISSVLDPSVPPSVFLPFESGALGEDMDNMWSFIRDGS